MVAAAAAVPAAVVAAVEAAGSGEHKTAAHAKTALMPKRRVVSENDLPGDPNWPIRQLGAPEAMLGYTGQSSVLPGEPVTLFASTTARSFTVSAFRMGWYKGDQARLVWKSGTVRGGRQKAYAVAAGTNTVQTDWGPSLTIPTHGWPEGSYLLRMDAESGPQRFVPVTVRSARTAGKVVLKNSTATWQAYNTWGGYDLYNGPGGAADYDSRSLVVSLDRPLDQDGASAFLAHERPLIQLAERMGLPLAYVTSMEIATEPHLLDGASALFSLGHDEYWTPEERAHVTAARNRGVNVAFLGANCCFRRIRLAPTSLGANRQVICYKTSYTEDPLFGKDNALVTNDYRELPDPDPESSMTGTLYESNPTNAHYVVASPDSWLFAGTGAAKGTSFPGIVGIEYDRVNPDAPVERPIEVLSHSPLTCRGVNSYSDSAYYTHASGAGVFNTGTMRWVGAFDPYQYREFGVNRRGGDFVKQVTANVLRAFADGPAAAKYPARDNLDAMQEYAGDPIAAQHDLWPPVVL
jgi:N,N-dimethylformamidase beta subunit-like protein